MYSIISLRKLCNSCGYMNKFEEELNCKGCGKSFKLGHPNIETPPPFKAQEKERNGMFRVHPQVIY